MARFFTKLIGGASTLVDAIDQNVISDEDKKALESELAKASLHYQIERGAALDLKKTEAYSANIDGTRINQCRMQKTERAGWMTRNIHSLVTLGIIIGLTFWMYWYILFSGNNNSIIDSVIKDVVIYILGVLTTVSTRMASYFFGSSQSSAHKNQAILDLAPKEK